MNKCLFVGRLTKAPECNKTSDGKTVAKFSIAVDRKPDKNGERQADFPTFVAFDKKADFIIQYLDKGYRVAVESELRTGSYKNQEGKTIYTTDFLVTEIQNLEPKKETEEEGSMNKVADNFKQPKQEFEVNPDDLPF